MSTTGNSGAGLLDRDVAMARVGGDADLLTEIAGLFLEECPKMLTQLAAAIESGDAATAGRTAHSLKGSVANFGASAVVKAALELEQSGRAGDLTHAPEVFSELKRLLASLHGELASLR